MLTLFLRIREHHEEAANASHCAAQFIDVSDDAHDTTAVREGDLFIEDELAKKKASRTLFAPMFDYGNQAR